MNALDRVPNRFDEAWKVAVERFLKEFLCLCFRNVHDLIDWSVPPEFLDTELQDLGPEHAQGGRTADKLVKVRRLDGREEWLFIHIEIQAQPEGQFSLRMWTYYYRIWDKYGQRVVSLAILADDDPKWRPGAFETETAGCRLRFEFPTFKVLDFQDAGVVFERTGNPFALVMAAHQMALATSQDPLARYEGRFRLIRYLRRHGLDRAEVQDLWRVIHVLTRLPRELELQFKQEVARLDPVEGPMSISKLITPLEEIAREEGLAEGQAKGRAEGLVDALEARFGSVPEEVRVRLRQIADESRLRRAMRLAVTEPNLAQFLANL